MYPGGILTSGGRDDCAELTGRLAMKLPTRMQHLLWEYSMQKLQLRSLKAFLVLRVTKGQVE
jgi:hypothetical protein